MIEGRNIGTRVGPADRPGMAREELARGPLFAGHVRSRARWQRNQAQYSISAASRRRSRAPRRRLAQDVLGTAAELPCAESVSLIVMRSCARPAVAVDRDRRSGRETQLRAMGFARGRRTSRPSTRVGPSRGLPRSAAHSASGPGCRDSRWRRPLRRRPHRPPLRHRSRDRSRI